MVNQQVAAWGQKSSILTVDTSDMVCCGGRCWSSMIVSAGSPLLLPVRARLVQQSAVPRLSEPLHICNPPSEENALELYSHREVSPPYNSAGTVTVTRRNEARTTPHASVDAMEFTCAEEPRNIFERSTHDLSTVHPECLHLPSMTLSAIPKQTEPVLLCHLATRARATMTESKYQSKATCNTLRPAPSHEHPRTCIASSSLGGG